VRVGGNARSTRKGSAVNQVSTRVHVRALRVRVLAELSFVRGSARGKVV
jgi:hypothetical protein